MFSRSAATQAAYEARIDALLAGEKAYRVGVRVLERSDFMAIEPEPTTRGATEMAAHLLVNVYNRSHAPPFMRWINDGLLQYADIKKFPTVFALSVGRRLPDTALQNKVGTRKILTEKNLSGWRKAHAVSDMGNTAMFSRSAATQAAYEARIDALLAGGKAKAGTRIFDRSDIMGLLGYPDVPLVLNEPHLLDGKTSHPEMTAQIWKKIPQWLDNPALAYRSLDSVNSQRVVLIDPEEVAGSPVVMVIEPHPRLTGGRSMRAEKNRGLRKQTCVEHMLTF